MDDPLDKSDRQDTQCDRPDIGPSEASHENANRRRDGYPGKDGAGCFFANERSKRVADRS